MFYPLGLHAESLSHKVRLGQSWLQARLILKESRRPFFTRDSLLLPFVHKYDSYGEQNEIKKRPSVCVCAIVSDTDRQRKKERESIEMVGCHSEICLEYIMKWTSEIVANRTWAFRSRDVRRAQKGNDDEEE